MQKAIFLDRDGILIRERGDYNYKEDHIEIVEGIAEALQELKKRGYIFIVVTNQSGISKRLYTHQRVKQIHGNLKMFFAEFGVVITDFYYCPHRPEVSKCICRKPDSQMLEKAAARFNIDITKSYFVGDNDRDIDASIKAGIEPIRIPGNADLREYLHLFA